MPANISSAAPTGVMPQTLCLSFSESRDYETLTNTYHDGSRNIGQLALSSRRSFKISSRLTTTQLSALKSFWDSHDGGLVPFYFYNPYDGSPVGSNWDATGVNTLGRYTVVFRGDWSQSTEFRTTIPNLDIIEVA